MLAVLLVFLTAVLALSNFRASAQSGRGAVAILVPGAGGAVPSDFLIRNEGGFRSSGIETIVVTSPSEAATAANSQRQAGRKVVIVGMSRGANMTAAALASGAVPNGVVFVSGPGIGIMERLGSPARLPATLVVHHRRDGCDLTSPAEIQRFVAWSRGRARIQWIDNSGPEAPNPCGPFGAHGFYRQDGAAMATIVGFIKSR